MVKLVKIAFQKDMIKVNENGKEVWYDADPKVKNFVKSSFHEGDDIELNFEQRNGKACIVRVSRPGQAAPVAQQASAPVAETPAPTTQQSQGSWRGQKSPEESEKITRLSVLSSATQAAAVLTGQINDPAVLADVVVSLYNKFLAEIKK